MPSFLAWLDASERERRMALDVIDLFKQKDTLDELGIGSIRDTIAEVLTPGTSTIQTRARYFFLVPWTYLGLESRRDPGERVSERARRLEVKSIEALSGTDEEGVIGRQAGAGLRRLPSAAYWAGLAKLGFRYFPGSQDQYHRSFSPRAKAPSRHESGDVDLDAIGRPAWDPHLPVAPADFPGVTTLNMTAAEAEYFRGRLAQHAHGSLLHVLVERKELTGDLPFPWLVSELEAMPERLRAWLHDARCYSDLMHGVQLLYNLMLARKTKEKVTGSRGEELTAQYETAFSGWAAEMAAAWPVYVSWDQEGFWRRLHEANPHVNESSIAFSREWLRSVLTAPQPGALMHDPVTLDTVKLREWKMKKGRARLANHDQLLLWGGASGTAQLDYRWKITRQIVNDIVAGLAN